ncbi:uncharacterized protein NECHADRAFT_79661 [Fusarium vanettenii 77-13-4]|uniref:Uncharacterized protein n=1 Tax=Fusarium vanettenii (strain ATCC MYA-4622 / CBS 123669 / FGSC 9596 / NRRL 45880 / 77-13-4) TaxID=660122 RepID=C7Z846_FUSV7|nr:uncharacterized protein NECHADRAFT_79661 [Fusarium vanettenii 77-13-4]EEU39932.1 hypothetical protein NECHADRAFT_79661 [Fusarium vanettenii 77-13-4]
MRGDEGEMSPSGRPFKRKEEYLSILKATEIQRYSAHLNETKHYTNESVITTVPELVFLPLAKFNTMAEIFGAAAAAFGVLEQVSKFGKRILRAKNSPKDLPPVINQHMLIVDSSMAIITLIENEEPFKTRAIQEVLKNIQASGAAITTHLQGMCATLEKGGAENFTHQLFAGAKDLDELQKMVAELKIHKQDLGISLESVHVGLTQQAGQAIAVNTAVVQELNDTLKKALGDTNGLKIARIVQNRQANGEGLVFLQENDITELSGLPEEGPSKIEDNPSDSHRKERYIEKNKAIRNSFMQNVPVSDEPDAWAHIDIIRIADNEAIDGSTMVNYPVSSAHLMALINRPIGR